jgi:hypothetical protein
MTDREHIVDEIRRLLEEQIDVLRQDLTPVMLSEYKERHEKIRKLIAQIVPRREIQ